MTENDPTITANLPRLPPEGFEIWFFVVLLPHSPQRALWVRLTRFADHGEQSSRVWAAAWDEGGVNQARKVLPADAFAAASSRDGSDFEVRFGRRAMLGHGRSRGTCGPISWDLTFEPGIGTIRRVPHVPDWAPLGMHVVHPHAEAPVHGWMKIGGRRIRLDSGRLTQMHIWGTRRVEKLRWAYALDPAGSFLELTSVKPGPGMPMICALDAQIFSGDAPRRIRARQAHSGTGGHAPMQWTRTDLLGALRARVHEPGPGILEHVARRGKRLLRVRLWDRPEHFVGWQYKQPNGESLHVAQSDVAHCLVEIYERSGFGWRPVEERVLPAAALEFHQRQGHPGFEYAAWGWGGSTKRQRQTPGKKVRRASKSKTVRFRDAERIAGSVRAMPRPRHCVALGLTYRDHVRETGSRMEPVVFRKDVAAWQSGGGVLLTPSEKELRHALRTLDQDLAFDLESFGFLPPMLDYEVELGLYFARGFVSPEESEAPGLVLVSDFTCRSVQVLGEGAARPLDYWGASKSFPGFLATGAHMVVPRLFDWEAWPHIELATFVNGEQRQQASVELIYAPPRDLLRHVVATVGPLPPGTLLLTGTPAGVAANVPAWKRALAARVLSRVGRLRAALGAYINGGSRYLRPGDRVRMRAEGLDELEWEIGSGAR